MGKIIKIFCIFALFLFVHQGKVFSQLNDIGGIGSITLTKEILPIVELELEQEIKLNDRFTSLERSATSIAADFTIIKRYLKAKVDYNLLYRRNDENYEFRHRASFALTGQYRYDRFTFRLRSRIQTTYRSEDRGDYSYNPKYVWRNRFMLDYNIRKSPFRPYISAEIFCPLNSDYGFFMDSYRLAAGTRYNLSKRSVFDFQLRFDQDIQQKDARNILYLGVGWSYAL